MIESVEVAAAIIELKKHLSWCTFWLCMAIMVSK